MEPSPSVPSPSLFDLSGQNVLITGASRGLSHISLSLHYLISPLVLFYFRSLVQLGLYANLDLGIGAACAIALAEAGATICLVLREPTDHMPPNLTTIDAIHNLGATAHFVHCDLNNLDSVKGVFQKALDVMGGRIDVLVNCAGIQRRSPSLAFSETDWDDVRSRRLCSTSVLVFSQYSLSHA